MVPTPRFHHAFALAAGLSLAACSDPVPDPRLIDPMRVRAVGIIEDADGAFKCNHTMIGLVLSATSRHCADPGRIFTARDGSGTVVRAALGNYVSPGSLWIRDMDKTAGQDLFSDSHFMDVARDKSIVLMTEEIGQASGIMPIASIDTLAWTPVDGADGLMRAPVNLITHWPSDTPDESPVTYKFECYAVRARAITEIIAHDCPTRSGVSGSPLVIPDSAGGFALVAVHEGKSMRNADTALARIFAPAFEGRVMGFASVFGSMPALCEALENCRAHRTPDGYATLALTQ